MHIKRRVTILYMEGYEHKPDQIESNPGLKQLPDRWKAYLLSLFVTVGSSQIASCASGPVGDRAIMSNMESTDELYRSPQAYIDSLQRRILSAPTEEGAYFSLVNEKWVLLSELSGTTAGSVGATKSDMKQMSNQERGEATLWIHTHPPIALNEINLITNEELIAMQSGIMAPRVVPPSLQDVISIATSEHGSGSEIYGKVVDPVGVWTFEPENSPLGKLVAGTADITLSADLAKAIHDHDEEIAIPLILEDLRSNRPELVDEINTIYQTLLSVPVPPEIQVASGYLHEIQIEIAGVMDKM